MKIERISDTQVKFVLNGSDLVERGIKINELSYGSEKMNMLFREMMEQAINEYGFQPENNVPLMIEAIPVSSDSIMIIVTKVVDIDDFDIKLNLLPEAKDDKKYMSRPIVDTAKENSFNGQIIAYTFSKLDDVINSSARLYKGFSGSSSLYKNEKKYYLIIRNDSPNDFLSSSVIETVLCEYGNKEKSSSLLEYSLMEHGEIIIKENAINVLANL